MKPHNRTSLRLALCLAAVASFAGLDATAASYSDTIQSQNPIAYWRFNDSVTVPVVDSVANLGSLAELARGSYSGATHPVGGVLTTAGDSAARVTGGQHVRIPWSVDINPAPEFSVEGWFRPAVVFTDGTLTCAISSGHFAAPRAGWLIYQSAGGFNFRMYNQNGGTFSVSITGGGPLVAGAWYHVVATYDGATATLYVNGVAVAQGNGAYVPAPDGDLTVGMRADNAFGWSGDADEVAVYGAPLIADRVQAHYALALTQPAVGDYQQAILADAPLGYWPLNEPVFVPPVALNAGSRGAELNGAYRGGATSLDQAPRAPDFIGFEEGNTALNLDGKDDYVGTLAGLMNPLPKFTISGWVRRAVDQATRSGLWGQNDIVEFGYINNNTIQAWTDGGLDLTPNPFPNEQWSHLALVCNGPTISIYTNGVFAVKRNHSLPAANNFAFNIGGGGVFDGGGNFFNGQIDEVALFDKPLTAADVCNQYAAAVVKAPEIVSEGEAISVYAGSTLTLPVLACGSPTLTYQWYRSPEELVAGATTAVLTLVNAQPTDSGDYFARVSNEYGSADSTPVTLTVLPPSLPVISAQPVPSTRYQGAGATFLVAATGTPPFQYQWQKDSVNIEGATAAALTLDPVQSAQAGAYRVLIKNSVGELFSEAASLTVLVPAEGSYAAEVVKTRPVAFWRLGEGEGETAFDYVGGLHGTYVNVALGSPGSLVDGLDTAADFNGGDSAVTTPASMNNFTAFTLTGWVRRAADQGTRRGLFGQNDLIEFGFIDNETIEGYIDANGSAIDIANPLANEQWGFVVLRGDANSVTVILNGVEAGRNVVSLTGYGSSAFGFNIGGGGIFDAAGNGFLGQIDEVALYNRALSSEEICGLYLTGSGLPFRVDVSPVGAFHLDGKPSGERHEAQSSGASWIADDDVRGGVVEFSQAEADQIVLPAHADFNTTAGTIAFWVRSSGASGPGNDGAIIVDRRGGSGDVIVQLNDGTIFVQAARGPGAVVNSFSTSVGISDGAWHHVAYVYNQAAGGSTTVYIDGAASGTKVSSGAWAWEATRAFEIGRSHDTYWRRFDGRLDDFRIYNRELTEGEVATLFAGEGSSLTASDALKVRLSFDTAPKGVTLSWPCGVLQQADGLRADGTTVWSDVVGALSPLSVRGEAAQRYYRVRR